VGQPAPPDHMAPSVRKEIVHALKTAFAVDSHLCLNDQC
jgi:hypothetical protein